MIQKDKNISSGIGVPATWVHLLLLMMFFFTGKSSVFADFAGGSGTIADPFQISTIEQLQAIKDATNTSQFILINDIDASATAGWNDGQGFEPRANWFNGGIDGQGFTISNLTINRPGLYQTAIIGSTGSDAEFKDINFENVSITGGERTATLVGTLAGSINNVNVTGTINGGSKVGALVGQLDSNGSITNSDVDASVTGTGDQIGGLLGLLNSGASVANINVKGSVSGVNRVGGLTGQANSASSITDSHTDVTVTGTGVRTGGMVGYNNQGNIENSSSAGNVIGDQEVGGLIGRNESAESTVSNNYSTASVTGDENVGGLIGFINGGTIELSYSSGEVSGVTNVGGLVGFAGWSNSVIRLSFSTSNVEPATGGGNRNQFGGLVGRIQGGLIENSFARGNVNGNNRVGGLVGEMLSSATVVNSYATGAVNSSASHAAGLVGRNQGSSVSNSFWDTETSGFPNDGVGQGPAGGVTGKTTAEMLNPSTFTDAGWDFDNIWSMNAAINEGYPYLTPLPPVVIIQTYFSRANGNWNVATTWSTIGHGEETATQPPGPNDNAIVADNDTVTLTSNVANNGQITIGNTGTLVTNEFHISGAGSFVLAAGGTLHIGSDEGISASGGSGSIKSSGRNFSTQANYVYDGTGPQITGNGLPDIVNNLTINNSNDVQALGDQIMNGQLILINGTLIMPPGKSLVTFSVTGSGQVKMQQEITGSKGWRMVSSPVNTNYEDLFNGFVSQGFTGSDHPELQPNILWFEETVLGTTNMGWRHPETLTDDVNGGRGHFHYVFNGAGLPGNSGFYNDTLPVTMTATGQEYMNGASFNFNITHTERPESNIIDTVDIPSMNTGWNLVGNPTTASLDWQASTGWTRTNVDETFYVWVAGANDGEGGFMAWNASITDIEDPDFVPGIDNNGLIAPFQAFWVRANAPEPVFSMTHDVKTTGAVYAQQSENTTYNSPVQETLPLALKLQADGLKAHAYVILSEKGKRGEDPWDAYQLEPMGDTWLKLFTTTSENQLPMVINNLPFDFEEMVFIPVYLDGMRNKEAINGTYSLKWSIPTWWPAHLKLTLMDHEKKESIPMQSGTSGKQFQVFRKRQLQSDAEQGQKPLNLPPQVVTGNFKKTGSSSGNLESGNTSGNISFTPSATKLTDIPRFSIVISQDEYPEGYIALTPELLPPYPNPASRSSETTIRFSLPESEHVTIRVLDLHGRHVQTIANSGFNAGYHYLSWFPASLNPGIYLVVLQSNNTQSVQKLIIGR